MAMEQETTLHYLSVKALTAYIKRKFDADPHLQRVWVVGEISNFRFRANGHQYFNLKDDSARINAVMYKTAFNRIPFKVEEGMKVLAVGRITLYEPSGQYQITIDSMEPDGIGALYQALEQLKQKLHKEGLFDRPKRPIPRFPRKIAVITSPTGSVIRDILTTIQRRYPVVQVTVFPTRVQGKEAAGEIVAAFNKVTKVSDQFDTVILARGGGSIEDLWCFNEEPVAHAILECPLPVISSIGHETDTTISDLVADMRAPTPTAAAELSVPVLVELLEHFIQVKHRLYRAVTHQLNLTKKRYDRSGKSYTLTQPERLYQPYMQQLDMVNQRFDNQRQRMFEQLNYQLNYLHQRLATQHPSQRINQAQQESRERLLRLKRYMQYYLQKKQTELQHHSNLLDAYSPLKIMSRGYALVETEDTLVKSISQLAIGEEVTIQLADGKALAEVRELNEDDGQSSRN